MKPCVLIIFGTRPEAIKMAPVIQSLKQCGDIETRVCVTAQHREMLDQVLDIFQITPDVDLDIMEKGQDLFSLTARLLLALQSIMEKIQPALVLVHGDTTTTMVASLAAYYCKIPVGHVEAGLRTQDNYHPFPEEVNRKIAGCLAELHFAPTGKARQNLLREGIGGEHIHITGNTVIDALLTVHQKLINDNKLRESITRSFPMLGRYEKMVLITGHRRENFGEGFLEISRAIAQLAGEFSDICFLYPVHLNPNVRKPVETILANSEIANVFLIEPVDYLSFVILMDSCHLVLTDSGGIQEEAPALGKPVVVMRETTERPEGVDSGTVILAGNNQGAIYDAVAGLLEDEKIYRQMSKAVNPYGDGKAADRITEAIGNFLETRYRPDQ